jgi:hypothetical protein
MGSIGYIVLPPGHGKSYRHSPLRNLLEADSLVPCKSTTSLIIARKKAKLHGNWLEYDTLWASMILETLPPGRVVLMVPTNSVGISLGGTFLGAAVLNLTVWSNNLKNRVGDPVKYASVREEALLGGARVFESNEELTEWVDRTVTNWQLTHLGA